MSVKPVRLRLSRAKGFNLQALSRATNGLPAVNVARPSRWGNPWRCPNNPAKAVDLFRRLFEEEPSRARHLRLSIAGGRPGFGEYALLQMRLGLPAIAGHNLACWCAPDAPCHADVLLDLANREEAA